MQQANLKTNNIFFCLIKYLSFLLGVFITMPIITLKFNGTLFSMFTIIYAIVLFILPFTLNSHKIILKHFSIKILLWFILTIVSSIYGLIFFINDFEWYRGILVYIPKILSFIYLLVFLFNSKYNLVIINYFFNGFMFGCVMNLIWACFEGLFFYFKGYSLSNVIFKDFIETMPENRKYISIVSEGGIRVGGFNYDPAHLGTIIPIVFIYSIVKKEYVFMLLSLLALIFSQSTTALVCVLILIFLNIKKIRFCQNISKHRFLPKILFVFVVIIMLFNVADTDVFLKSIKRNYLGFTNRISTVYINNKEIDPRTFYHIYLPDAIFYNGINTMIGTGFNTASYPFVYNQFLMKKIKNLRQYPYDPESLYISYLFDVGILGLLLYIYILLKIYLYFNRNWKEGANLIILATFGGIIFSGFFYHYTLAAFHVVSIIMAVVHIDFKLIKVR